MEGKDNKPVAIYVICGILAVAVIALFILVLGGDKKAGRPGPPPTQTQTITLEDGTVVEQEVPIIPMLPIAYIQTDSIYSSYRFFIDRTEIMQDKYSKTMTDLQSRERKIQQDVQQFEQDVQNNRYLTRQDMEQKQVSLQRRYEDLQKLAMQADQENQIQLQGLNQQLIDSINSAVDILNANKKYQMIFLNQGLSTILYADETYDLTEELLILLNSRYTPVE